MSLFSFKLPSDFLETYKDKPVDWGFKDAGGNSLGEITFLRTYSRLKEDGTKETWAEVCQRVIEGMFSIQKDYVRSQRLPWRADKAQRTAQDAYDRMFTMKWLPPGRGLWVMGTDLVMEQKNGAPLLNCAFVSTGDMTKADPTAPFTFLMEASMLGVGVGFDTLGAKKHFPLHKPTDVKEVYEVPDTREGWVESLKKLLESYLIPDRPTLVLDTSLIRPEGTLIKTFGGKASGPGPLIRLHDKLSDLFDRKIYSASISFREPAELDVELITDICNLIARCVVSGNVRRSALLAIGELEDDTFLNLKNPEAFPERNSYSTDPDLAGWAWSSNNSIVAEVGQDLSHIKEGIVRNGEPGVIWLDTARAYGRLIDPQNNKDHRIRGFNPCAEQGLESFEACNLVELFMNRHTDLKDFQQTAKLAFLYAKTVTLLPTHWPKTNAIMLRNRRIGCSVSGVADFTDSHNMEILREWLNETYETVQHYDNVYSEWLCVRESIKTTTVKPSGSVSILAGASPGAHWGPGGEYFNRAIRFGVNDPMVLLFRQAGYTVEADVSNPADTVVVYFPVHSGSRRSQQDVSVFEKANLAVLLQRYWSDNSVSVTLTFDPETESDHIGTILDMHTGQLKTVSFLPSGNTVYPQQPYTAITEAEFEAAEFELMPVDLSPVYAGLGLEAIGEQFCTTDTCLIKEFKKV